MTETQTRMKVKCPHCGCDEFEPDAYPDVNRYHVFSTANGVDLEQISEGDHAFNLECCECGKMLPTDNLEASLSDDASQSKDVAENLK